MTFIILNLMCLDMNLLELSLRICWDSWLNGFHQNWEMWLLSSQPPACPSLSLSLLTSLLCLCCGPGVPWELWGAVHPPSFLFPLHCPHHLSQPGFRISHFFLQQVRPAIEAPLVSFSLQSLYFSAPEFLFGSIFKLPLLLTFFSTSCTFPFIPHCFILFYFCSLNIFLIANLTSLLGFLSELPQGYFLLMTFFYVWAVFS